MIGPGSNVRVYLACGAVDMRKGIDGLAALAQANLRQNPASGAVFSLLPPENATGNFTKVVQRVPVRIAIPQDALDSGKIRAGLSVIVDIDTRTAPEDKAN